MNKIIKKCKNHIELIKIREGTEVYNNNLLNLDLNQL